jgi:hypothetical protein
MTAQAGEQAIYWHRELPPLAAEAIGEHGDRRVEQPRVQHTGPPG